MRNTLILSARSIEREAGLAVYDAVVEATCNARVRLLTRARRDSRVHSLTQSVFWARWHGR